MFAGALNGLLIKPLHLYVLVYIGYGVNENDFLDELTLYDELFPSDA
jgi:hypothetical protein